MIEENNIQNYFKFYIDNNEVNNQTINLNVKSAKLSIDLYPEQIEYFGRYSYFYEMDVNNLTNDNLENITVEVVLGKELEYKSVQAVGSSSQIYDKNTGILKLKYDKINANETKKIAVRAQANQFEDNKYIYNVKLYVRASV